LIPLPQSAPFVTAEAGAKIGRTAAENQRHLDPACNREPGATAHGRHLEFQFFARPNDSETAGGKFLVADPRPERPARPCDPAFVVETQTQSTQGYFKEGGVFAIAHEQVDDSCRERIEGAA
jgi:hypothetical protein